MNIAQFTSFLVSRTPRQLYAYCQRVNVEYRHHSTPTTIDACICAKIRRTVAQMSDSILNDRREYDTDDLRKMYELTPNHAHVMRRAIADRVNS